ncbi:MAG: glycosyltransferase family 4 protein [Phycisphaerae bacterium]|nr:glycosyltransferase family 4 protein [Phycisphaerae bacterium]
MKIIHIITRLILGGAQENTLITCRLLAQRGHEVTLITGPALGPEGELFTHTVGKGYKTYVINELRREITPLRDYIAYSKLKALIQGIQPDIVHTHSAKAGILGRRAAYHASWRKRPMIVHGVHGLSFHPYQPPLLNKLYIALERRAARWTDHFITVADAMTTQSRAVGIGTNKPYTTAYSAIDEEAFVRDIPNEEKLAFRREHHIPEDAVVLVTVARLFMLKGHDYIIESAKTLARQHPNAIWLFVGNGNLARRYTQQIQAAGLSDRFRFTGLLQPDQIPLAIQASDMLVHCSLREGLARTLPQAMLCARPAISFDVDGAREVVNDQTGRLIEPKNIDQLIGACSELIQDARLRETLGSNGLALVREKFAPDTMVDTIEQVYQGLKPES